MQRLIPTLVPAYACLEGTKMHFLNLGTLNVDEGRDLMLIAGLIYHPDIGLILFECGAAEDV
ncbi:hypothetical protein N7462_000173 [Penicillium macrosclerotiorum]|uniref:uncharacterized protein n=1 Tax=Penicillium macrosclerotiorum TaxID=303699 RepID=UPI002547CC9C|nr:uncharacterized protein N7462_000173 [Penicillium macrosclerotiorum]KAJ5698168.1 hypothetical protein N7462_000173 [Penicillium macrosclerotiorum]